MDIGGPGCWLAAECVGCNTQGMYVTRTQIESKTPSRFGLFRRRRFWSDTANATLSLLPSTGILSNCIPENAKQGRVSFSGRLRAGWRQRGGAGAGATGQLIRKNEGCAHIIVSVRFLSPRPTTTAFACSITFSTFNSYQMSTNTQKPTMPCHVAEQNQPGWEHYA